MADKASTRKRREIWFPAEYTPDDIRAVQALALYAQAADEHEARALLPGPSDVRRALDWIINNAAQTFDNGFVASDPGGRIAAFVDGRQFVGQQIIKLMKLKPEPFEEKT